MAGRADVPTPASPNLDTPGTLESFLDETMAEHLERFELAGATVTVVKDGEIVVSQGIRVCRRDGRDTARSLAWQLNH